MRETYPPPLIPRALGPLVACPAEQWIKSVDPAARCDGVLRTPPAAYGECWSFLRLPSICRATWTTRRGERICAASCLLQVSPFPRSSPAQPHSSCDRYTTFFQETRACTHRLMAVVPSPLLPSSPSRRPKIYLKLPGLDVNRSVLDLCRTIGAS